MISFYLILTTLTTIGYGDINPKSSNERLLNILIHLIGVALFSYALGSFTHMIAKNDKNKSSNYFSDLQNWVILLGDMQGNKKIKQKKIMHRFDQNLVDKIETHYTHLWQNNRNEPILKKGPHFITCPKSLRIKLMEYLWGDVYNQSSKFFLYHFDNKIKYQKFYYEISFHFLPRM